MHYMVFQCALFLVIFNPLSAAFGDEQLNFNLDRKPTLEVIHSYHDDNGFTGLNEVSHYKLGKLNRQEYLKTMQTAFDYFCKGHEIKLGIHLPYWSICFHPILEISSEKLSLYMYNDAFKNEGLIGTIPASSYSDYPLETMNRIHAFVNLFNGAEPLVISYQRQVIPETTSIVEKEEWDLLDDYIIQNFVKALPPAVILSHSKNEVCDEVTRLIGEYFRLRDHITKFCIDYVATHNNMIHLHSDFKKFLMEKGNIEEKYAEIHAKALNIPSLHKRILARPASELGERKITRIFEEFYKLGLFPTTQLKQQYQEIIFGYT